jgi:lipopolysaccharide/colanic/teichoic acid biosynthesis glycosyltransferase
MVVGAVADPPASAPGPVSCPVLGPCSRLAEIVDDLRPDRIVVALPERRGGTPIRALLELRVSRRVIVEDAADVYERLTGKLLIEALTPASIVFSTGFRPSRIQQAFARIVSLCAAVIGLVGLWPLLALIALAIKLDSQGRVLSVEDRVGAHGRRFKLLKFRTVHASATTVTEAAGDRAERVTRVGRWLRAVRLDALPQVVNMLRGEMNLVGPRPHAIPTLEVLTVVARNLSELSGTPIGFYTLRSTVPPGLIGWAQVRHRAANDLEEELETLRFDLYYVKHASPWFDLRIMLEALRIRFSGRLDGGHPRSPQPLIGPPGPSGVLRSADRRSVA